MNKKALYNISYGLYIVCSRKGDKINGQIANTVVQVCSEPPMISVAINAGNYTHEFIDASKMFSASILARETPLSFIGNFGFKSGRDIDKFAGVNYIMSDNKIPIVTDYALAYLEAKVVNKIDVGTHTIYIGELVDADVIREGEPITYAYYQQVKRGTTPKSAPSYIETKKESKKMDKYECSVCGYIYDPELGDPDGGIKPGTPFEEIPDSWVCPVCGAAKEQFKKI